MFSSKDPGAIHGCAQGSGLHGHPSAFFAAAALQMDGGCVLPRGQPCASVRCV